VSRPPLEFLTGRDDESPRLHSAFSEGSLDALAHIVRKRWAGQGLICLESARQPAHDGSKQSKLPLVTAAGRAVEEMQPQGDSFP
jgi:hypothetical protein